MASNEYETIRQATATFADILRTLSESYAPMLNELRETVAVSLEIQSNVLQALESFKPELAKVLESMDTYKSISQELSELINEKIIKSYSAIDYSALIKSIRDITIQETFVSVPESLISNVPQHEWDISSDIHSAQQTPVMRQLSITNAKRILYDTLVLLIAILALLRAELDSVQNDANHKEVINTLQEQISITTETNNYLLTLIEVLADIPESDQTDDVTPDYSHSEALVTESSSIPADLKPPTSADESDDSE